MVLKFGYVLVIMMTLTKVYPWTIDLPEVRRYLFEKLDKGKSDYKDYISNEKTYYDNVNPNSLHTHTAHEDHSKIEKEVLEVVRYGGAYLEGLRRAVERYIDFLENCTSTNNTRINVPLNTTWLPQREVPDITNVTIPINGGANDQFAINQTDQRFVEPLNNTNVGKGTLELCQNITRTSEYVRRVAELAVWTTKRLQDLVYAEEYQHDNGKEEDELIFKLAWFLDRLAKMTGYMPDPKSFMGEERRETTTTIPYPNPPIPTSIIPEDIKRNMMNCIKRKSPIPATIRCAFPLPLPPGTAELFNLTDIASTPQPSAVSDIPQPPAVIENIVPQDVAPGQPSELLTAVESASHLLKSHILNPSRNYQKRDVNMPNTKTLPELSDLTSVKTVKKRSINENPLINLMKYYVKHSAWVNSNPTYKLESHLTTNEDKPFDVPNHLTDVKSVQKRSMVSNKSNQVRIPEIPMPDLSKYIKNKPGIHYLRDHVVVQKIKNILERMHNRRVLNNKNKLAKPFRVIKKRSLHYEQMYLPRESENPKQDISYYIKNKDGTDYNPSLLQAAQARAALERHFLTGDIVTVRQYSSNDNPLIPAPLFAGILMTLADS